MNSATLDTKDSISANDITITITAYPEHIPIGELLPEESEEYCNAIMKEAEWNVWAWACLKITATIRGHEGPGVYLGGCSYASSEHVLRDRDYESEAWEAILDCYKELQKYGVRDAISEETIKTALKHSPVACKEDYW